MKAKVRWIKFGESTIAGVMYTKESFEHLIDKDINIPIKDRLGKVVKGKCTRLTIDGEWLMADVEIFDYKMDHMGFKVSLYRSGEMKKVSMGYLTVSD